jgi:hypothetical protein
MNLVDARETAQAHRANNSEMKWSHKGPDTIKGGGHSDAAKSFRQSPPLLGQEGDRHDV